MKKDMILILDIMQVTFVTVPVVNFPTASLSSQGMGMPRERAMLRITCCNDTYPYRLASAVSKMELRLFTHACSVPAVGI